MKIVPMLLAAAVSALAAACTNKVTAADTSAVGSSTGAATPNTYVLDFTGTPGPVPGLFVGGLVNLAFTTDLDHPIREFAFKSDPNIATGEGAILSNDFTALCNQQTAAQLETHIQTLPAGTSTYVDHVDVEFLPLPGETPDTLKGDIGTMCYGYREPAGAWHWIADETPSTYDASSDRVRARLDVRHGPLDAVKIVPKKGRAVSFISYVTAANPGTSMSTGP